MRRASATVASLLLVAAVVLMGLPATGGSYAPLGASALRSTFSGPEATEVSRGAVGATGASPVGPDVSTVPTWVNLSSEVAAPVPFVNLLVAYDPDYAGVIYYGGLGCGPAALDPTGCVAAYYSQATWEYNAGSWENISFSVGGGPNTNALAGLSAMVFDPQLQEMVLWTAVGLANQFFYYAIYSSTWVLGAHGWQNLSIAEAAQPKSLGWMTYDPAQDDVVALSPNGSTWTFANGTWNLLSNSLNTVHHSWPGAMVWDQASDSVIMAGLGSDENDTWSFAAGVWTNVTRPGPAPSGLGGASLPLEFVPELNGLVEYGGEVASNGTPAGDTTWLFASGGWSVIASEVGAGPPPDDAQFEATVATLAGTALYFDPVEPTVWAMPFVWALTQVPIVFPTASPADPETNHSMTIRAEYFGGTGPYAIALTGLPAGCVSAGTLPLTCEPTAAGPFTIEVNVTDSAGFSGLNSVSVLILQEMTVGFAASPSPIDVGQSWSLAVSPLHGVAPYRYTYSGLPAGCSTGPPPLVCWPTDPGNFSIVATVNDSASSSQRWAGLLTVDPAPTATLAENVSEVEVGEPVQLVATEGNGTGPLNLTWSGLPSGCTGTTTLVVGCVPTVPNTYVIQFTTEDSVGARSTATVALDVVPRLDLAGFGIIPGPSIRAGAGVVLTVNVTGGIGADQYAYSGLPGGCADADTSTLRCDPSAGHWTIGVTVVDSRGVTVQGVLSLTVTAASGLSVEWYVAVGAGAAAAVGLVLLGFHRRAASRRSAPEDEEDPSIRKYGT